MVDMRLERSCHFGDCVYVFCQSVCLLSGVWSNTYSSYMICIRSGHVRMISEVYFLHKIVLLDDSMSQKSKVKYQTVDTSCIVS